MVLSVFVLTLAQAQDYYWVFFKNKAGSTFNPYEYFDAKAVERYRMNGVSLYDSTNFPLNGGYVSQVEGVCEELVGESRWLNAVGIGATPEQIAAIERMPFVKRVVPIMQQMELTSIKTKRERDTNLWSTGVTPQLRRMKGEKFVEKGIDGKGIRIAVIDGGFPNVDKHPAFAHLRADKRIIKTWNFAKRKADVYSGCKHGHGAWVLSCIAGKLDTMQLGLATGAEFLLANVDVEEIASRKVMIWWTMAAEWADKNGADIINSSLGFGKELYFTKDMDGTSIVAKAANLAARKGMLVCNSAGNEGSSMWHTIKTPADADSVLTVGGIDAYLSEYRMRWGSSKGPTADGRLKPNVCSYGVVVCAKDSLKVDVLSGTSFSAALTSGFAACAWQCRKGSTAMQMKAEMERSADLYPYYDYAFGYGVPQANYFLEGKETPKPTFHFEQDSANVYFVPDKKRNGMSVFFNLQNPSGRLVQYGSNEMRSDADTLSYKIFLNKEECAGYTANFCMDGYTASYAFEGQMRDMSDCTESVFKTEEISVYNTISPTTISEEPFGKDERWDWKQCFRIGTVVNNGNSDLNMFHSSFTYGNDFVFQITKIYRIGLGINYHRRNYYVEKDKFTHFDQALGFTEEAMDNIKFKKIIERGFDLELFQRVRFAFFGGYDRDDVHWDLGVYGSLNWQRYSLRMGSSGDYGKLSFGKLRYASLLDWGVTTRFTWKMWSIYGRYRLSGLNKTFDEPRKYFEELPRFEVGIGINIDDFPH